MYTDGLMTTRVVDAHVKRVVATSDVVSAYLSALIEDFLAMELERKMVDYIVQADPESYLKHAKMEYGKKLLHLRIVKALYGCIKVSHRGNFV